MACYPRPSAQSGLSRLGNFTSLDWLLSRRKHAAKIKPFPTKGTAIFNSPVTTSVRTPLCLLSVNGIRHILHDYVGSVVFYLKSVDGYDVGVVEASR